MTGKVQRVFWGWKNVSGDRKDEEEQKKPERNPRKN